MKAIGLPHLEKHVGWPRHTARLFTIVWAVFWCWFGLGSGIAEGGDWRYILLHTTVPGLLFAVLAAMAWRWESIGGWSLILVSFLATALYLMQFGWTKSFWMLTVAALAAPPLVAGILLLIDVRQPK